MTPHGCVRKPLIHTWAGGVSPVYSISGSGLRSRATVCILALPTRYACHKGGDSGVDSEGQKYLSRSERICFPRSRLTTTAIRLVEDQSATIRCSPTSITSTGTWEFSMNCLQGTAHVEGRWTRKTTTTLHLPAPSLDQDFPHVLLQLFYKIRIGAVPCICQYQNQCQLIPGPFPFPSQVYD